MGEGYSYWMNLLIWLDQGINALLGGSCDETLSSRTYRMARLGKLGWTIFEDSVNRWFFWDESKTGQRHCELAYLVEMRRGHMPRAMARELVMM